MPLNVHAFAQAVFFDHAAGHERIGHLSHVIVSRIAEEAVAVGVHFQDAAAGFDRSGLAVFGRFELPVVAVVVLGNPWPTALRAVRAAAIDPAAADTTAAAFFPFSHVILHSIDPLSHAVKKPYGCIGR